MEQRKSQDSAIRAALYVDGFNLYVPIAKSGHAHLKWVSLWALGEQLCRPEWRLEKVLFCSALPVHRPDSNKRHVTFNSAQLACGVKILNGHYVPEGEGYSEKQTDINLALSVILDGLANVYDVAIILSADSDQVATARAFREKFQNGKQLFAAIPPGQTFPQGYQKYRVERMDVDFDMLERCILPERVKGLKGDILRPARYAPHPLWVPKSALGKAQN